MNSARHRRWLPVAWLVLSLSIVMLDFLVGPRVRFPVLLLIPITLVAWFHDRRWAIAMAIALPLPRIYFRVLWDDYEGTIDAAVNAMIRIVVFAFVAALVATVVRQKRELERHVEVLHGILPICMFCKKIRDADGRWEPLEVYVSRHSEAEFSHGMCTDCARQNYPGFFERHDPSE